MSELRQLIERLKHGKHDQSTHGRRRGGGGGASASGGGMSSSESRQANRDDKALIAQSKREITRLEGMKKQAQDAIARGGETQPDGTFRQYSQGEMDYYKKQVATNDRFIESNQRTIQTANDRIRGRRGGDSASSGASASSGGSSKPPKQTEYQKYAGKRDAKLQNAGLKPRSYNDAYQASQNAKTYIDSLLKNRGMTPIKVDVSTIDGSFDGDMPTGHYGFLRNNGTTLSGQRLREIQGELKNRGITSKYVNDNQIEGLVVSNTYDYGS